MSIKFGTAGWRGIIAKDFTFENVQKCTQALCNHLKKAKAQHSGDVIIAHDSRFMGNNFAKSAAYVLKANGFNPIILKGNTPTPVAGFAVKTLKAIAGINFTASHNPPEYQGFKYITSWGGLASSQETTAIEAELEAVTKINCADEYTVSETDVTEAYLSHLKSILPPTEKPLNILVNPMFGTSASFLPQLLTTLGHQVSTMQMEQDPLFGGISPDPQAKNLINMQQKLKEGLFDLGLATDADADRFGVLTEKGDFVQPNDVLAYLVDKLAPSLHPQAIGMAHVTGSIVERVALAHNLALIKTPVGFKNLGALMQEGKTALGCEESSGFAWNRHVNDKDGIVTTALIAQLLSQNDAKPLTDELKALYNKYGQQHSLRLDLRLTAEDKNKLMKQLKDQGLKELDNCQILDKEDIDALKFILEDGRWVAFRPSGTEPLVRVYMDANSLESLESLKTSVEEFIKNTTV